MQKLLMDVHIPFAISDQLRRRGIDVQTAQEDGALNGFQIPIFLTGRRNWVGFW